MIALIQRVSEASVSINNEIHAEIGSGILILLGISVEDTRNDAEYLARKILQLRIFNDSNQIMNLSVNDISGEILLISQFTLMANTKKGNRPSYINAARPEQAIPLYEYFIEELNKNSVNPIKTGVFGADMKVGLVNNGPVTISIDSKL